MVTALLFAGRAGTSLTAEIGLMKAGEQLSAMEMMAVDPVRRILAPRFWAGVIAMPLLAAVFSAVGIIGGWVVGVLHDRRRPRRVLGPDAGRRGRLARRRQRRDQELGVRRDRDLHRACCRAIEAQPTPEGVSRATTRTVVVASLSVLGLDFVLTALMFSI